MESSRHTPPAILAFAVVASGVFLLQQSGFFNGIFRTDILASAKAEDALSAADIAAMEKPVAVNIERSQTASVR